MTENPSTPDAPPAAAGADEANDWRAPKPRAKPSGPAQPQTRAEAAREYARALSNPAAGDGKGDLISGQPAAPRNAEQVLEKLAPDVAKESKEPEPAEPKAPEQSTDDVLDFFLGPEERTAEEAAQRHAERTVEALRSGAVVQAIADAEAAEIDAIERLTDEKPGIATEEAMAAMDPLWDEVEARYPDIRSFPDITAMIVDQIYEVLGGEEQFGTDPYEQAYLGALGGDRPKDIIS